MDLCKYCEEHEAIGFENDTHDCYVPDYLKTIYSYDRKLYK